MPDPDRTQKEINIQNDTITNTVDKWNSRCYMSPVIPTGKVSCMSIKYVKGADNGKGARTLMFGVSGEDYDVKGEFLGSLEKDWSIHLYDGYIFHDEINKDKDKPEGQKLLGTSYGYRS